LIHFCHGNSHFWRNVSFPASPPPSSGNKTFGAIRVASCSNSVVVVPNAPRYISPVSRLTKQEQMFLCTVIGLLLVGWTVKTCRTAHPPAVVAQEVIH
jgi:hypothetical protein